VGAPLLATYARFNLLEVFEMNKVILMGNLTADPDVRATPAGLYVAKLRLATNEWAGKDDAGQSKKYTEYHHLVVFGKQAQFAGTHLKKGRSVGIEGRLQTSSWEDAASGAKKFRTEVVVDKIEFAGAKPHEVAA